MGRSSVYAYDFSFVRFREAAKKVFFSVARPLRGGGAGKGPANTKKNNFFSPKNVKKFFLSKSVSGYFKTKKKSSYDH